MPFAWKILLPLLRLAGPIWIEHLIYSLRVSTEEFLDLWDWTLRSARPGTPSLVQSRCIEGLSFLGALSILPGSAQPLSPYERTPHGLREPSGGTKWEEAAEFPACISTPSREALGLRLQWWAGPWAGRQEASSCSASTTDFLYGTGPWFSRLFHGERSEAPREQRLGLCAPQRTLGAWWVAEFSKDLVTHQLGFSVGSGGGWCRALAGGWVEGRMYLEC